MAFHVWSGKERDYGSGELLSAKEFLTATKAANSYDWEEDKNGNYPQLIKCRKSGQIATRRSKEDPIVWDRYNNEILMLNQDEFTIKDIIT